MVTPTKNCAFACRLYFCILIFSSHLEITFFVYDIFAIVHTPLSCNVLLRVLHRALYRSWCVNSRGPWYTDWRTRGSDCPTRFTRFTLVKAVFDALQPPATASGEPAGKAKRPKTSSSTTLVVRQTRRNKSVLLFQLRSEHFLFHVKL